MISTTTAVKIRKPCSHNEMHYTLISTQESSGKLVIDLHALLSLRGA
jgi:hypothetical protein